MDVYARLKYLDAGAKKGVKVKAIIEYPGIGIAHVEEFKVYSKESAEEDICEIILRGNEHKDCEDRGVFYKMVR